jgi:hypothetical protein
MRVLILLANLCVLIHRAAHVCTLFGGWMVRMEWPSCVYIHGFKEPMRVLIFLANMCVLIWPAKVCVLFLLANMCTIFASQFVLANVCVLILYTTQEVWCVDFYMCVYTWVHRVSNVTNVLEGNI